MLIVHEFVTPLTLQEERDRNAADLDRFHATPVHVRTVHRAARHPTRPWTGNRLELSPGGHFLPIKLHLTKA